MCNCKCPRMPYCLGNIVYIFERLASCCALTSVVTCIMTTVLIMLAIGVGLGYNYCFVDIQTGRNKEDEFPLQFKPVEGHATQTPKKIFERPFSTTPIPVEIESTMVAPLNIGINFTSLIINIRKKRMNVTLELIV